MAERNVWVQSFQAGSSAEVRMFCFPHAGAGAQCFRNWPNLLPAEVELLAVRLPGRETRLRDAPIADVRALVDAMAPALISYLDKPFVLFGHSLGALVAYEVAQRLREEVGQVPLCLIVSGRVAPQLPTLRAPINHLPDAEFMEGLRQLGGTPDAILNDAALMQQLGPMLRADLAMHENYAYRETPPLPCDILAFGGLRDREASRSAVSMWRERGTGTFGLRMVPGDHFYIQTAEPLFLRLLSLELYGILRNLRVRPAAAGPGARPPVTMPTTD